MCANFCFTFLATKVDNGYYTRHVFKWSPVWTAQPVMEWVHWGRRCHSESRTIPQGWLPDAWSECSNWWHTDGFLFQSLKKCCQPEFPWSTYSHFHSQSRDLILSLLAIKGSWGVSMWVQQTYLMIYRKQRKIVLFADYLKYRMFWFSVDFAKQ